MTDKGWVCLAVLLFFIVLALAMIALWRISSNLTKISKRLDETNDKLNKLYWAQERIKDSISQNVNSVCNALFSVYKYIFANAEVTIRRNNIEEDYDDDI